MRIIFPAAAILLLISGLSGCSEQTSTTDRTGQSAPLPVTPASLPEPLRTFNKTFTGNIAGKYGITMQLSRKGNDFTGTYFYTQVKQPIAIYGTMNADGILVLEEKDASGNITGLFEGTLYADSELTGKWKKPDGNKELSFSLKEVSTDVHSQTAVTVEAYSFSVQGREDRVADFSFPRVEGNLEQAVLKKINQHLSVQQLTDDTEEAIKKNFAECSCGLISSNFKVNYNKNSLLSITILSEWLGAYSSFSSTYLNIHTQTGERLPIEQLLKPSSLPVLVALANKRLQERIEEAKKEAAGTDEAQWVVELLADKKFEASDMQNFTVNEKGITFYYPFHFPHAALALEPDSAIEFTFEQLQQYISPTGVLAVKLK